MAKDFKAAVNKTNLSNKNGGIAGLVGHTDNNSNTDNIGNTDNKNNKDVRQTFVLSAESLDRIKDYVHYRRVNGDTEYTQKQALSEALTLLFATVPTLPKRK